MCLIMKSAIGPPSHRDANRISDLVGKPFFPLILRYKRSILFLCVSHPRRTWLISLIEIESQEQYGLTLRPILCRYAGVVACPSRSRIIWTFSFRWRLKFSNQGRIGILRHTLKKWWPFTILDVDHRFCQSR